MFTFNIIGVAPVLHFFNYQQNQAPDRAHTGVAYLSSHACSLDAVLRTIDYTDFDPAWQPEAIMQSAINFWLGNLDSVMHWQQRLKDAGNESILVSRVAHTQAIRNELEFFFPELRDDHGNAIPCSDFFSGASSTHHLHVK